jgi:hypothetical protein
LPIASARRWRRDGHEIAFVDVIDRRGMQGQSKIRLLGPVMGWRISDSPGSGG